jgi:hypothetical protein
LTQNLRLLNWVPYFAPHNRASDIAYSTPDKPQGEQDRLFPFRAGFKGMTMVNLPCPQDA